MTLRNNPRQAVAIIGMAGRFPGANSVRKLWENVVEGVDPLHVSTDEELKGIGHANWQIRHKDFVRVGGIVDGAEEFDAGFFGFSAHDASIIDPQHRVFLECAWEAFEDAGYDPTNSGEGVGVFAGSGTNTYRKQDIGLEVDTVTTLQLMVGGERDFLATRVAYKLNLTGPAITVQTACSTSLVAVHMAYESICNGGCSMALAGGVSIMFPQKRGYVYQPGMILSPDGYCRAFDARAGGTTMGRGAGIVLLKPLEAAIRDRDQIYAVIRGSAINNDGAAKGGYTAPGKKGQADVIRRAMHVAQFDPATVLYIEAHGTGTEVGDSIEIAALAEAFGGAPLPAGSCTVSSLKAQIGHLDAAAGVANLIKAAMAVRHRVLPGTMHFERANPELGLEKTPFRVHTKAEAYIGEAPYRAGVSSFGIGGTNAHVSLEEWRGEPFANILAKNLNGNGHAAMPRLQLFPLSAQTPSALAAQQHDLAEHIESHPEDSLEDIAFTLQTGRAVFSHRYFAVAADRERLIEDLRAPEKPKAQTHVGSAKKPEVYFMFPGQGTQYVNMGRGLYETNPVFRDVIDQCSAILEPLVHLDLCSVLFPEAGHEDEATAILKETRVTQPALFSLEYALAKCLIANGVVPTAMIGHSLGEYVAATIAGVFKMEHMLTIVANRGLHIQSIPRGSMLATSLSEEALLAQLPAELSIAIVNGPRQTIVSGPTPSIEAFAAELTRQRIPSQKLLTSHAFHSSMLDPIVDMSSRNVGMFPRAVPTIPYISNLTGKWITNEEATNHEYYGAHLRSTVRFGDGLNLLTAKGAGVFIEVGPGENLLSLVRSATRGNKQIRTIATTRRANAKVTDTEHYLSALGQIWLSGIPVDWDSVQGDRRPHRISLPTYPFERQQYRIEEVYGRPSTAAGSSRGPLVKQENLADWIYTRSWRSSPPLPTSTWPTERTGRWLLFADHLLKIVNDLETELRKYGEITRALQGSSFNRLAADTYTLDFDQASDYTELLQDLRREDTWPDHLLYVLSERETSAPHGAYLRLFHLAQALQQCGATDGVTIHVIADRAFDVFADGNCVPANTAAASFVDVLGIELRGLKRQFIDYDTAAPSTNLAKLLVNELTAPAATELVAYRGRTRWLSEWTKLNLGTVESGRALLRQRGTYILTGGIGGIGLVLAEHLARTIAAHVVLVSRSAFPPQTEWPQIANDPKGLKSIRDKAAGLLRIQNAGGTVELRRADVCDTQAMLDIVNDVAQTPGGLAGIIHAAGVSDFTVIGVTDTDTIEEVFAAKAHGTSWIEAALAQNKPDFVVLCSSMSAIVPSVGVSAYGSANAYLDGFAALRDDPGGTRVYSVNWDRWSETGMAFEAATLTQAAGQREPTIEFGLSNDEAVEIFDQVLTSPVSQIAVSTRNLPQWLESVRTQFKTAAESPRHLGVEGEAPIHARPELSNVYTPPENDIERAIVEVWQELLGIDRVGIYDDFFELGGHSLLGAQFIGRIRDRFQVDIPLRTIFETPTPAACARLVASESAQPASKKSVRQHIEIEREEIEI